MIKAVLLLITTIIISQDMDINIINTFLFHPRKSYQVMDEKDIQINVNDSVKVGTRFHLISKSAPTLLFFHGNGEIGPEGEPGHGNDCAGRQGLSHDRGRG